MYVLFLKTQKLIFRKDIVSSDKNKSNLIIRFDNLQNLNYYINDFISSQNEEVSIISNNPEKVFNDYINQFKIIEAAGGIVKNINDKLLFIYRLGYWDLPKGKIDEGESTTEAALREVKEECGVDDLEIISELITTFHFYELENAKIIKKTYWFEMFCSNENTPVPETNENITKANWLLKREYNKLLPDAYPLIQYLIEYYVNDYNTNLL